MAGQITYYTYDLMTSTLLAELPFTGVSWSQTLNAAGNLSASLDLADPKVQTLNPLTGTRPARTLVVVDVDGVIEWAGIIWARPPYDSTARQLQISADEAVSYWAYRAQAADYTAPPTGGPGFSYWTANPAAAEDIAAAVVADAKATAGSAFASMAINIVETISNANPVTESFPLTQLQTVQSMLSTLAAGGYLSGFDFAVDWQWSGLSGSTPVPTLTLNYPRRGRIAGTTGLVIDSATGTRYTWGEDGRQVANAIYGSASSAGGLTTAQTDPSPISAGYPLLELVKSYSQVGSQGALNSAGAADLAALEWPVISPTFDLPMFGSSLALGDFLIGDDARVIIPPDERFPAGLDTYLRIIGLAANPADAGESLMTVTVGLPPALAPVSAPPL